MSRTPQSLSNLTLCIIGGGLIGGSIARDCFYRQLVGRVVIFDANPEHRSMLRHLGFAHDIPETLSAAVRTADMVIICTPVGRIADVAKDIAPHVKQGAIISDVGSTKTAILSDLKAHLPATVHIIPGHPVAGTEKSGPTAALSGLFDDRWCIITPPEGADALAQDTLIKLWRGLGARVSVMNAAHHDRVLGMTSHVPHLIAYTIVGTAKDLEDITQSEVITYSAGGFRDFTRIAASDPTMWRDIFLQNGPAVLELIQSFKEDLGHLETAIQNQDSAFLHDFFTRTRDIRRQIVDAKQAGGPSYFEDEPTVASPYGSD